MIKYSGQTYTMDGLNVQTGAGFAFDMAGKYPLITKRIWDKLADAQAFVNNTKDSAVAGLTLTITGDTEANNGVYLVASIADATHTTGTLVRQATYAELTDSSADAKTEIVEGQGISVTSDTDETDGHTIYTIKNDLNLAYVAGTAEKGAHIDLVDKSDSSVIGSINVSDIVGNGILKSSAYDAATGKLTLGFQNASGGTTSAEIDLREMLDINDMSIDDNSKDYLKVTLGAADDEGATQAVFAAKIVTMAEATESKTGLADAWNVKQYVDAETTARENAIAALDVNPTNVTADNIKFTYGEADGIVNISGLTVDYAEVSKTGSTSTEAGPNNTAAFTVASGDTGKLVKASDLQTLAAYTADKVDEEMHRAKKQIADLSGDVTSAEGTAVRVEVKTVAGNVSEVIVTNQSASVVSGGNATDGYTLVAGNATGALVGSDVATIKAYTDALVADVASDLTVEAQGDSYVNAHVDAANNKTVVVSANTADVTASAGTRGTWSVTAAGVASLAGETAPSISGVENKLLDGAQAITAIKTYADAIVAAEAAERDAKIEAAVKALDVAETSVSTTDGNITFDYAETDGKVEIGGLAATYATITNTATTSTDTTPATSAAFTVTSTDTGKLVKASDLQTLAAYAADKAKEAADALTKKVNDLDLTAVGGTGKVITTVSQEDGKVSATAIDLTAGNVAATAIASAETTVAVEGTTVAAQIASLGQTIQSEKVAAETDRNAIKTAIGASTDASGATTVYGAIAKEKQERIDAIKALDTNQLGDAAKYVKYVQQTDGVVAVTAETVSATEVSYDKTDDAVIKNAANVSAAIKELDAAVNANKKAELTYKTVAVTGADLAALGENVKEAYKVVSVDTGDTETQVGEYIKIYKDSNLKSADFVLSKPAAVEGGESTVGQYLKLVYNLADGSESTVYVDMSQLILESEVENGIHNVAGKLSIKIDTASEDFLTTGASGLKLSGVANAISAAVESLDSSVSASANGISYSVTETDGKLTNATLQVLGANLSVNDSSSFWGINVTNPSYPVFGSDMSVITTVMDRKIEDIAISATGDSYVNANVAIAEDRKKTVVSTNIAAITYEAGNAGTWGLNSENKFVALNAVHPTLTAEANKLLDASAAMIAVTSYVNTIETRLQSEIDAKLNHTIAGLDAVVESTVDVNTNNVYVKVTEVDGKLTAVEAKINAFDCGEW